MFCGEELKSIYGKTFGFISRRCHHLNMGEERKNIKLTVISVSLVITRAKVVRCNTMPHSLR